MEWFEPQIVTCSGRCGVSCDCFLSLSQPTPLTFGTVPGICTSASVLQTVTPWIVSHHSRGVQIPVYRNTIQKLIDSAYEEIEYDEAEVMEEDELIGDKEVEQVCTSPYMDVHPSLYSIFVIIQS